MRKKKSFRFIQYINTLPLKEKKLETIKAAVWRIIYQVTTK